MARLGPPPRVEQFEQRQPGDLLGAKIDVDVRGLGHLPAFAPELLMHDVVLRPPLRIAQNLVRIGELAEPRGVAGVRVVGVKSLSEQPIHAVDRLRLGVRVNLKDFVVVHGVSS